MFYFAVLFIHKDINVESSFGMPRVVNQIALRTTLIKMGAGGSKIKMVIETYAKIVLGFDLL